MARSAKSALVLCMDVGFSMSGSAPGQEPPFEQAKKVIQKFVQRQVFAENKDELGLVLFGSDTTKNNLAKDNQYQNICVHRNLMIPDFGLLEEIQNEIHPGAQEADCLDALVVCMDLLQNETLGKKYDRLNIALLTDLSSPIDPDQLDIITGNLKRAGISLQFFLPFPVEADKSGGGDGGGSGTPYGGKSLSREQQQGLDLVKRIMRSLDEEESLEEVYTFSDAIEKLSVFKRVEKRPMAWPCCLTIGSALTIKIVGYKAVCEEKPRKSWSVVDAQTHQKDDVKRDIVYCVDDDEETEVPKEDTIQGYRYGSDIVPFSKVDQDQMKYKTDGKSFAVLGFAKQSLIHRHHFMGNQILKVFAPKDDPHAGVALSALIRSLDELKMVAVVRYVYARNGNPQVGAAFPCIKEKYEVRDNVSDPCIKEKYEVRDNVSDPCIREKYEVRDNVSDPCIKEKYEVRDNVSDPCIREKYEVRDNVSDPCIKEKYEVRDNVSDPCIREKYEVRDNVSDPCIKEKYEVRDNVSDPCIKEKYEVRDNVSDPCIREKYEVRDNVSDPCIKEKYEVRDNVSDPCIKEKYEVRDNVSDPCIKEKYEVRDNVSDPCIKEKYEVRDNVSDPCIKEKYEVRDNVSDPCIKEKYEVRDNVCSV
ncbi:hypothetical protein DPEC_G00135240 [Dallia pectoralis]|uniref:Uncharacterized protein n=1 Tax=Dallia pectoralis TaxID=75939 RepID=A0ACC2GKV9_DALPE|nr:hypothetical protein DPEC_G00135240 [Dallia pectoralis]